MRVFLGGSNRHALLRHTCNAQLVFCTHLFVVRVVRAMLQS